MSLLDRFRRNRDDDDAALGHEVVDDEGFVHAPDATPDEVPPPTQDPHLTPKKLLPPGFPFPGAG